MAFIYINEIYVGEEYICGETLADAAKKATEAEIGKVGVTSVVPLGGSSKYHTIYRDIDPEEFWLAMLAHTMNDNMQYGWGETKEEAKEHAVGDLDPD